MGFCRRCGDIVSGPRCKCGGFPVAPVVPWTQAAARDRDNDNDKWQQTYVSREKSPSRSPSRQENSSSPQPPSSLPSSGRRFPQPLSRSSNISNRISSHIASATASRPSSPVKNPSTSIPGSPMAAAAAGILPSPVKGGELAKVYGSILQPKETLATHSCAICATPFPPDATIYPDPSGTPASPASNTPRFLCRPCFTVNGGSRGQCMTCSRDVLILKSDGGFVENAGQVWHKRCFNCNSCNKNIGGAPMVDLLGRPCCVDCFGSSYAHNGGSKPATPHKTQVEENRLGGMRRDARPERSNNALEELEERLGISRPRSQSQSRDTARPLRNRSRSREASPAMEELTARLSSMQARASSPATGMSTVDSGSRSSTPAIDRRRRTLSTGAGSVGDSSPFSSRTTTDYPRSSTPTRSPGIRSQSGTPRPVTEEAVEEMKMRFLRNATPSRESPVPSPIQSPPQSMASMSASPATHRSIGRVSDLGTLPARMRSRSNSRSDMRRTEVGESGVLSTRSSSNLSSSPELGSSAEDSSASPTSSLSSLSLLRGHTIGLHQLSNTPNTAPSTPDLLSDAGVPESNSSPRKKYDVFGDYLGYEGRGRTTLKEVLSDPTTPMNTVKQTDVKTWRSETNNATKPRPFEGVGNVSALRQRFMESHASPVSTPAPVREYGSRRNTIDTQTTAATPVAVLQPQLTGGTRPMRAQHTGEMQALRSQYTGETATTVQPQRTGDTRPLVSQRTGEARPLIPQYTGETRPMRPQHTGGTHPLVAQNTGEDQMLRSQYTGGGHAIKAQYTGESRPLKAQYTGESRPLRPQYTGESRALQPQYTGGESRAIKPQYTGEGRGIKTHNTGESPMLKPQYTGEARPIKPQYTGGTRPLEPQNTGGRSALERALDIQYTGSQEPLRPQHTGPQQIKPQYTGSYGAPLQPQHTGGGYTPIKPQTTGGGYAPLRSQNTGGGYAPIKPQNTGGSYAPMKPQNTGGSYAPIKSQTTGGGGYAPVKPQNTGGHAPLRSQTTGTSVKPQHTGSHTPIKPQMTGTRIALRPQTTGSQHLCAKCGIMIPTRNGSRYVTLPDEVTPDGESIRFHTYCFTCAVCGNEFKDDGAGRTVFVRDRELGAVHIDCAPTKKAKARPASTYISSSSSLAASTSRPTPAPINTTPGGSFSSRYERPPLTALPQTTSTSMSMSMSTSTSASAASTPRFGGGLTCPGCSKAVSMMEFGVVPGPGGSRWHASCLVCGGGIGKTDRVKDKALKRSSVWGKEEVQGKPGCGKKLDSAAKSDGEGGIWCRECLLLLPVTKRLEPQTSPTRPATSLSSYNTAQSASTHTTSRQYTSMPGGVDRQTTGGGLNPTRSLSSSPTKQMTSPLGGSSNLFPGSSAGRRPRPKSVVGMRGKSMDEGRGMFLVRQMTGGGL